MKNNNAVLNEKCVSCGTEVGYTINTHVDSRKGYVEGVGQLCSKCFIEIYNTINKKDVDIDEEP